MEGEFALGFISLVVREENDDGRDFSQTVKYGAQITETILCHDRACHLIYQYRMKQKTRGYDYHLLALL